MNVVHPTTLEATVIAELPQHLFRLEIPAAGGIVITASLGDEARRLGVQVRTGQRVRVQRARRDPGRGIITGVGSQP